MDRVERAGVDGDPRARVAFGMTSPPTRVQEPVDLVFGVVRVRADAHRSGPVVHDHPAARHRFTTSPGRRAGCDQRHDAGLLALGRGC